MQGFLNYYLLFKNWQLNSNDTWKMFNIRLIIKKKLPCSRFSVPYATIFLNNLLHLLLNRCDLKLKPLLIDWSVFTSLGSGFMHFPEHFLVVVVIFLWLLISSPPKEIVKATLSQLLSSEFAWSLSQNLLSDEW